MSLAVAVGLAGLIIYYGALGEEPMPPLTEERRATNATLAWIEAESRGGTPRPTDSGPAPNR